MPSSLLDWVEQINEMVSENKALKAENEALRSQGRGAGRPNRPKLTTREVMDIRKAHRAGSSQAELAREYDVNKSTINRIVRSIYH